MSQNQPFLFDEFKKKAHDSKIPYRYSFYKNECEDERINVLLNLPSKKYSASGNTKQRALNNVAKLILQSNDLNEYRDENVCDYSLIELEMYRSTKKNRSKNVNKILLDWTNLLNIIIVTKVVEWKLTFTHFIKTCKDSRFDLLSYIDQLIEKNSNCVNEWKNIKNYLTNVDETKEKLKIFQLLANYLNKHVTDRKKRNLMESDLLKIFQTNKDKSSIAYQCFIQMTNFCEYFPNIENLQQLFLNENNFNIISASSSSTSSSSTITTTSYNHNNNGNNGNNNQNIIERKYLTEYYQWYGMEDLQKFFDMPKKFHSLNCQLGEFNDNSDDRCYDRPTLHIIWKKLKQMNNSTHLELLFYDGGYNSSVNANDITMKKLIGYFEPLFKWIAITKRLRPPYSAFAQSINSMNENLLIPYAPTDLPYENKLNQLHRINTAIYELHEEFTRTYHFKTYISMLYEYVARLKLGSIEFKSESCYGPSHDLKMMFRCSVMDKDEKVILTVIGQGESKKAARQVAAEAALHTLLGHLRIMKENYEKELNIFYNASVDCIFMNKHKKDNYYLINPQTFVKGLKGKQWQQLNKLCVNNVYKCLEIRGNPISLLHNLSQLLHLPQPKYFCSTEKHQTQNIYVCQLILTLDFVLYLHYIYAQLVNENNELIQSHYLLINDLMVKKCCLSLYGLKKMETKRLLYFHMLLALGFHSHESQPVK
ncbi:hypothetical protein SNEBB_007065 [Seison nebaliae]|nr:hypothetical protein SNEBB_007065 [Seison nebaliae]